eukprot:CAMPEP_0119572162 /NCGR_PEP_ID=MMETSP1352-20130426/44485_1 /TAXON_ID=265584 /ORGANISM="Stauroneis constricta, Strain CCMP1120" /LENGTH=423 /DNA_ID=CAMNT_0007621847 /DNA_START=129 /DNA_END=1400 /DNA_ORIENTATION=+
MAAHLHTTPINGGGAGSSAVPRTRPDEISTTKLLERADESIARTISKIEDSIESIVMTDTSKLAAADDAKDTTHDHDHNHAQSTNDSQYAHLLNDPELKPILKSLNDTSIFNDQTIASLPRWSQVEDLYGASGPKIYGLETCQTYRDNVPLADRKASVAGMFNSGTNLLSTLLAENCFINPSEKELTRRKAMVNHAMQWQVPWGKHFPARFRNNNTATRFQNVQAHNVLPVVTMRDPYTWMVSMCRQNYNARFEHAVVGSCPNIIPYPSDIASHPRFGKMKYIPVNVKYTSTVLQHHDALPLLWNEWYREYYNDLHTYPRLIVRLEDLVFRGEETIQQVCDCVGGTTMMTGGDFRHMQDIANQNAGIEIGQSVHHGLFRSIVKYGNATYRGMEYPNFQLQAARDLLDAEMMDAFGYKHVPMSP